MDDEIVNFILKNVGSGGMVNPHKKMQELKAKNMLKNQVKASDNKSSFKVYWFPFLKELL